MHVFPALIVVMMLVFPAGVAAQVPRQPSAELSPAQVVELQLDALQNNDVPVPDNGIRQTWAFAHPANKRMTGPLARFALMIRSPNYETMLYHRSRAIEKVVQTEEVAQFAVTIETRDGEKRAFHWVVQKVISGPLAGAWLTISVSPPLMVGDST